MTSRAPRVVAKAQRHRGRISRVVYVGGIALAPADALELGLRLLNAGRKVLDVATVPDYPGMLEIQGDEFDASTDTEH